MFVGNLVEGDGAAAVAPGRAWWVQNVKVLFARQERGAGRVAKERREMQCLEMLEWRGREMARRRIVSSVVGFGSMTTRSSEVRPPRPQLGAGLA